MLRGAVDAREHDRAGAGEGGIRCIERLARTGRGAAHRVAEPCGDVELVEQLDQYLRLDDVGDRLDGDEVGLRAGEQVEPPSVEVAQARPGDAVVASILRAVGEEGAVGSDGRSDPWTGPGVGELIADLLRESDAAGDEPTCLGLGATRGDEALDAGLVAGRGRHLRPRREVRAMSRGDALRIVDQEARRPEVAAEVTALLLECCGEPAVEHDDRCGRWLPAGHALMIHRRA